MKNEIGRKLTSLTIMAIMFAGGMTFGCPRLYASDNKPQKVTSGLLTVSTTTLQGAAILEIVVQTILILVTLKPISAAPTVDVDWYIITEMNQATNGKWYLYVADDKSTASVLAEAQTRQALEFGIAMYLVVLAVSERSASKSDIDSTASCYLCLKQSRQQTPSWRSHAYCRVVHVKILTNAVERYRRRKLQQLAREKID